jgi:signal transduction histidine kinase
MAANGLSGQSAHTDVSSVTTHLSLRELCHDLVEPTATIRWLVSAAESESGEDFQERLKAIAVAAGQIAAICDDVLDGPRRRAGVRLDKLAMDAVASARVRYAGVIELVSQPVMALACPGDIIRILCNILANACRAAGPVGKISVHVEEADGQARLSVADSGSGLDRAAARSGAGLGLGLGLGLEIVGALALKYGGSVRLGIGSLGGLMVTVELPAHWGSSN